jgi:hypothetical protein
MTIKGVVIRFLLTYVLLLLVLGQILSMLGVPANEAIFIGVLAGSSFWPCLLYGKRNGRYFTGRDKLIAIQIMLLIDVTFQILFGNVLLPGMAPLVEVALSFVILLLLHAAVLMLVTRLAGRLLARQGTISQI